jgi:hypothetical protein
MAASPPRLDVRTIVCVLGDVGRFAASMLVPRAQLVAENLFPRNQLSLYVEGKDSADASRQSHNSADARRAIPFAWLAPAGSRREAGNADSMASKGSRIVLAMEIEATRPTARTSQPLAVDRGDGRRELHVG